MNALQQVKARHVCIGFKENPTIMFNDYFRLLVQEILFLSLFVKKITEFSKNKFKLNAFKLKVVRKSTN